MKIAFLIDIYLFSIKFIIDCTISYFQHVKLRSNIMGKARDSKKETKKEPAMTAKEKKAAKKAKKQAKS